MFVLNFRSHVKAYLFHDVVHGSVINKTKQNKKTIQTIFNKRTLLDKLYATFKPSLTERHS